MDPQTFDPDSRLLIDSIFEHKIKRVQSGVECCGIATYNCVAFQWYALDILGRIKEGELDPSRLLKLNLAGLAMDSEFFEVNIIKGCLIWKIVVYMRAFTSQQMTDRLKNLGTGDVIMDCGGDPNDKKTWNMRVFRDLYGRVKVEEEKYEEMKRSKVHLEPMSIRCIENSQFSPGFQPNVFLNVEEIFKNIPGLCWIDSSERLKTYHIMMPALTSEEIYMSIKSIVDEILFISSIGDPPELLAEIGRYKSIVRVLIQYQGNFYLPTDFSVLSNLLTIMYAARDKMTKKGVSCQNGYYPVDSDGFERLDGGMSVSAAAPLNPVHTYSLIGFIESLLSDNSPKNKGFCDGEETRDEVTNLSISHLRSFVFTFGGGSFCVICNTVLETFLLVNSHRNSSDHETSSVSFAANKYGCYAMILRLALSSLCSGNALYIEVIEVSLTQEDIKLMAEKSKCFLKGSG